MTHIRTMKIDEGLRTLVPAFLQDVHHEKLECLHRKLTTEHMLSTFGQVLDFFGPLDLESNWFDGFPALVCLELKRLHMNTYTPHHTIRVGSRVSATQTKDVVERLQVQYPQHIFQVVQHACTRDLQSGAVDLLVCDLRNVDLQLPPDLHLAAISQRDDAHDVFVSTKYRRMADVPDGGIVGITTNLQVCHMKNYYYNLKFEHAGPVESCLAHLWQYEGVLLPAVDLQYSVTGIHDQVLHNSHYIEESEHTVAQGAIGIACRQVDVKMRALCVCINHPPTETRCCAEREMLQHLTSGGYDTPVSVLSSFDSNTGQVSLQATLYSHTGEIQAFEQATCSKHAGKIVAQRIMRRFPVRNLVVTSAD